MKKYIKPNIEVVAGGSMQIFAATIINSPNTNGAITKDAGEWEPEQDVDLDW